MAKVKSIKFYNFVEISGVTSLSINVNFYDTLGHLILMDFSNPISLSTTRCETLEYIVTASNSYNHTGHYLQNTFHTGNTNFGIGISAIGYFWAPAALYATPSDFLKIEFKNGQDLSDIKVLHTFASQHGFKTCNYDIEYGNGNTKTYKYTSNGELSTLHVYNYLNSGGDQKVVDDMFDSIDFDKVIFTYDTSIGYIETLDTNNFRSIPINTIEKLKSLCIRPLNTHLNCLISFDKKQTWKTFDGTNWITISDISPENIILNGMEVSGLNSLDKKKLISGGFTGDLDFKIAMKTNDTSRTPSVTKIYIEYK